MTLIYNKLAITNRQKKINNNYYKILRKTVYTQFTDLRGPYELPIRLNSGDMEANNIIKKFKSFSRTHIFSRQTETAKTTSYKALLNNNYYY